jgi:hypothetical protein
MGRNQETEMMSDERTSPSRFYWMLMLAAALPLLPGGMFAGFVLALMVGYVLLSQGNVKRLVVPWMLLGLVLTENLVFLVASFR